IRPTQPSTAQPTAPEQQPTASQYLTAGWYRRAAEAGDKNAMTNLGLMYADGRGVAKDEEEAVRWYRRAAEAGNAAAMHNLGFMYRNGRGVSRDMQNAAVWVFKALRAGNEFSYKQVTTDPSWGIE